jgi:type IV pilus assembly protein PilC
MAKYLYRAKDWSGKLVSGELEMGSEVEVVESIREGGLTPLSVMEVKDGLVSDLITKVAGRVGMKEIAMITRQMATMMMAGLPLTDALQLLKSQSMKRTKMTEIMEFALSSVRGGRPLGQAFGKYRDVFGEAYVASIEAGEEGGVLEKVLFRLANDLEKDAEFRGKVKGALIYPVIVIMGMIVVAIIMMVFVIPKLMSLYTDFGSKMPTPTLILMAVSNFMIKTWFLIPIGFVGLVWGFKMGDKLPTFRLKRDELLMKLPIVGYLVKITVVTNTVRTLSMLLSAGVQLVDSLRIVAKVAGNEVFLLAYGRISDRVQKGFSIADSFAETGAFPAIVNQMVETGESTGKLDEVLMKVADYFSMEADQSVKSLTAAIEPLIMIVLGIGVAFLVIAVIMPIYNLTASF